MMSRLHRNILDYYAKNISDTHDIVPAYIKLSFILVMSTNININIYTLRKEIGIAINNLMDNNFHKRNFQKLSVNETKLFNDIYALVSLYYLTNFLSERNFRKLNIFIELFPAKKVINRIFSMFSQEKNIEAQINKFNESHKVFLELSRSTLPYKDDMKKIAEHIGLVKSNQAIASTREEQSTNMPKNQEIWFLVYFMLYINSFHGEANITDITNITNITNIHPKILQRSVSNIKMHKQFFNEQNLFDVIQDCFYNMHLFLSFDVAINRAISEVIYNGCAATDSKLPYSSRYFVPKILKEKIIEYVSNNKVDELAIVSIGVSHGAQEAILLESLRDEPLLHDIKINLILINKNHKKVNELILNTSDYLSIDLLRIKYSKLMPQLEILCFQKLFDYEQACKNNKLFLPTFFYSIDSVSNIANNKPSSWMTEEEFKEIILNKSENLKNIYSIYTKKIINNQNVNNDFSTYSVLVKYYDMQSEAQAKIDNNGPKKVSLANSP